MILECNNIIKTIRNYGYSDSTEFFEKNIGACIIDLESWITKTHDLLEQIYRCTEINEEETKCLHSNCRIILSLLYTIVERLDTFSKVNMYEKGIRINASKSDKLSKLINVRGANTHRVDPIYSYFNDDDSSYFGCTCDSAYDPYEGKCTNIKIDFIEADGTIIHSIGYKEFLQDIHNEITIMLNKYYERLKVCI
jgi:hypothetical protein